MRKFKNLEIILRNIEDSLKFIIENNLEYDDIIRNKHIDDYRYVCREIQKLLPKYIYSDYLLFIIKLYNYVGKLIRETTKERYNGK